MMSRVTMDLTMFSGRADLKGKAAPLYPLSFTTSTPLDVSTHNFMYLPRREEAVILDQHLPASPYLRGSRTWGMEIGGG